MLLELTGRAPQEVHEYLSELPGQSKPIGMLFRRAKERRFTDWDALLKEVEKKG
jgi:hypothetical protein